MQIEQNHESLTLQIVVMRITFIMKISQSTVIWRALHANREHTYQSVNAYNETVPLHQSNLCWTLLKVGSGHIARMPIDIRASICMFVGAVYLATQLTSEQCPFAFYQLTI